MSSIYRFSIRSLRHFGVSRVVELAGQASLGELQAIIVREFRLDWDHAWAFWLGGEWYERELEYGGHPGDGGRGEGARIEPLGLEPGDLLAHAHDFGEQRRHVITLVAVSPPEPGVSYPRVVERVGEAPSYYGDEEDTEEEFEDEPQPTGLDPPPSLVERVNAAIEAFYDDAHQPPPAATLRASAELAQEALATCSTPEQVGRLDAALDSSLEEWLAALATGIEDPDLLPVAAELRARLQALQGTAPFPAPLLEALASSLRRWERGEPFRLLDDEPSELVWLAREVLQACASPDRLAALARLFSASVGAWLEDASLTLGLRGEPDAAVAIAARLASWRQSPDLLVELAGNLVEADPSEYPSARAAFGALLDAATSVPEWRYGTVERTWARHQAASGDPPGAESRLRALVGRRHLGTEERASAIEALAELLVVRGASDEAALLRGQAAELERRRAELTGGTVRNVGPKVGRNAPCPCGSGKKLKKCCGG